MKQNFRSTHSEINLSHLEHNLWWLRQQLGQSRFISPMVKADAYGHGAIEVAKVVENSGFNSMGVCLIEEGVELRKNHISSEILVYNYFDKSGAEKIIDAELTPVVGTWEQIYTLENLTAYKIDIHVKINTGMNRNGFSMDDVEKLKNYFKKGSKLNPVAVCSHFHSGEDACQLDGFSRLQADRLLQVVQEFKDFNTFGHLLNSSGILSYIKVKDHLEPHYLKDYLWGARPGITIYGYTGSEQFTAPLKPVMTLKSTIENVRLVSKGETVSYGATWTASEESVIGTIPVGYADGYHRSMTNKIHAVVRGFSVPVRGTICMDFIMLDLTKLIQSGKVTNEKQLLGEEVILFGWDQKNLVLGADVLAKAAHTISYEILTSVSSRVPRVYKGISE